jgi:hypothetical protein
MRLTEEVKKYWQEFRKECDSLIKSDVGGVIKEQIPMVDAVLEMFSTIEAQQQEIEHLQAQVEKAKTVLKDLDREGLGYNSCKWMDEALSFLEAGDTT